MAVARSTRFSGDSRGDEELVALPHVGPAERTAAKTGKSKGAFEGRNLKGVQVPFFQLRNA